MQEIELRGLEQIDRLAQKLTKSPEIMARAKREAFQAAATEAKRLVDDSISTALKGDVGKVQRWQEAQVGSRGGYAAVRPKKGTWTEATKKEGNRYAVGAVTNAIVSGHKFPAPSGKKYYKPRIKISGQKVPGRPFYEDVKPQVNELAQQTAQRVLEKLLEHLEE